MAGVERGLARSAASHPQDSLGSQASPQELQAVQREEIEHVVVPASGGRREDGSVGDGRTHRPIHLVAARPDVGPDHSHEHCGVPLDGTCEFSHAKFGNSRRAASPSRVNGGNRASHRIDKQDRNAIGGANPDSKAGLLRPQCVGPCVGVHGGNAQHDTPVNLFGENELGNFYLLGAARSEAVLDAEVLEEVAVQKRRDGHRRSRAMTEARSSGSSESKLRCSFVSG